ncbi:MAG: SpoIIE family protein phosphatase [Planctomycetaceae bacterium]|nr:SpoIIE family protein phosphatase [Planctomycetaceae bacterium]
MIAFLVWDTAADVLSWTESSSQVLDCPSDGMPRSWHAWLERIYPEDRPRIAEAVSRLIRDRVPFRLEHRILPNRSQVRRVHCDAAPLSPTIVVASLTSASEPPSDDDLDLSGALEARADLARFFELSPDLFCIADVHGYFRRVNANFRRVLGHDESELLSRPYLDFVHPDDRAATLEEMARLSRGDDCIQFRNRYRDVNGAWRWFEWTARPAPGTEIVYSVARDVTERMEIESQLLNREVRERAVLDNIASLIHLRDRQGRFEFCNRRFLETFDRSLDSILGRTAREAFPEPVAELLERGDQQAIVTGRVETSEEVLTCAQGVRNYITSRIPLRDSRGNIEALASVSTDITEQIRARESLRQFEMARTVQQKLYPARPPVLPGFDIDGVARPVTQLCGDYFDFVPSRKGRMNVIVGDVSGHGLGPALQMVELRALLRTFLRRSSNLPQILEDVNELLCADLPDSMFISLFLAELDPQARSLRFVSAGHPAWHLPADGPARQLKSTGMVLGLVPTAEYQPEVGPISLKPGDIVLLSTDGVVEAMSSDMELYGKHRMQDIVSRNRHRPSREILEALFADIRKFVGGRPITDDMTAIIVKAT